MKIKAIMALSLGAALLSGCYSFQGPEKIMRKDARPYTNLSSNIEMFIADFGRAEAFRNQSPMAANPHITPMLRSGFMHNYAFCDNYFNQMVQNQRRSQIVRSTIPPITAIITGLIGLHDFSRNPGEKEDLIQLLALGSAGAHATLNIYDQHFLFGSDNIGSVKAMALKAQNAHAERALSQQNLTFEMARQHLIDNQSQCAPETILSLARSVMKDADLEATTQTADGPVAADNTEPGKVTVAPK